MIWGTILKNCGKKEEKKAFSSFVMPHYLSVFLCSPFWVPLSFPPIWSREAQLVCRVFMGAMCALRYPYP